VYDNGHGFSQGYPRAVEWYRKAANQGSNAKAQYNLGNMYENGHDVSQDLPRIASKRRRSGENGDALIF